MFHDCPHLEECPVLPAMTIAAGCYCSMFQLCTALTAIPALPATTLAENCYYSMFASCTAIEISETKTDECNNAFRIPSSGTGTEATGWNTKMFRLTSGTFTGAPAINTVYCTNAEITQ